MKKYSEINTLYEIFGTDKVEFQILNENLLKDFVGAVKDKFFNDIVFINSPKMNELKYAFGMSLIKSLSTLKFPQFKWTNMILNPKDIIPSMQEDLINIIEKEKDGSVIYGYTFNFLRQYKANESLIDECEELAEKVLDWLNDRKNIMRHLNIVNKVGYKYGRGTEEDTGKVLQAFFDNYKKPLSDEMSTPEEGETARKIKDSQYTKIVDLIIEKLSDAIDVEFKNIFIMNDEEDLKKVATSSAKKINTAKSKPIEIPTDGKALPKVTPLEKEKEEPQVVDYDAEQELNQIPYQRVIRIIPKFGTKYNIFISGDEVGDIYKPLFLDAYKEVFIKNKGITPTDNDILAKMKELYDTRELAEKNK